MGKTSCFYEVKSTSDQPTELLDQVVSVYVRIVHVPKTETLTHFILPPLRPNPT